MICPKCNHENPEEAKFCCFCGAPIEKKPTLYCCPNCKKENPKNAVFCYACGTPLAADKKNDGAFSESLNQSNAPVPEAADKKIPENESKTSFLLNKKTIGFVVLVVVIIAIVVLILNRGLIFGKGKQIAEPKTNATEQSLTTIQDAAAAPKPSSTPEPTPELTPEPTPSPLSQAAEAYLGILNDLTAEFGSATEGGPSGYGVPAWLGVCGGYYIDLSDDDMPELVTVCGVKQQVDSIAYIRIYTWTGKEAKLCEELTCAPSFNGRSSSSFSLVSSNQENCIEMLVESLPPMNPTPESLANYSPEVYTYYHIRNEKLTTFTPSDGQSTAQRLCANGKVLMQNINALVTELTDIKAQNS